jgi:DNA polymerase I-like protein with 3'-5' exonuclease and polymerase domains
MTNIKFLAFFADPLSQTPPILLLCGADHEPRLTNVEELSRCEGPVVTLATEPLVELFRNTHHAMPVLIDLEVAFKLAAGLKKDERKRSNWNIAHWIRISALRPNEQALLTGLMEHRILKPAEDRLLSLLANTSRAIRRSWDELSEDLEGHAEWHRFLEIEVPVHQVLLSRQKLGIAIDKAEASNALDALRQEKFTALRSVAAQINRNPTTMTYQDVLEYVGGTDAAALAEFGGRNNLESYFKVASQVSSFAAAFRNFKRASAELVTVLRVITEESRTFPVIDPMGTVTGRVQVRDPALQQLRKRYRGVLRADEGFAFIYLDYAQFEPGVLAQLCGQGNLQELYNTGDVYRELSVALFGSAANRAAAKRIFIAYCYGMEPSAVIKLISLNFGNTPSLDRAINGFFEQFPEIERFRNQCQEALQNEGIVSSLMGNHRKRIRTGILSSAERRWAMNHVVQSTASLIFKQAILNLAQALGVNSIVLPMHDAVLLQVPEHSIEKSQSTAILSMTEAFSRWCPDVRPRITASAFRE